MYIDYDQYVKAGGCLSFEAFEQAEPKAEAELRYLTFMNGDIFGKPDPAVALALCSAVDLVAASQAAEASSAAGVIGIKSESNDGYSVSYITDGKEGQTAEQALRARVYQAVRAYLLPTGWLSRRGELIC